MPYDEFGREIVRKGRSMYPLKKRKKQESAVDRTRRIIEEMLSQRAEEQGKESFSEANDFDIIDDDAREPVSEHEFKESDEEFLEVAALSLAKEKAAKRKGKVNAKVEEEDAEEDDAPAPVLQKTKKNSPPEADEDSGQ